MSQNYLKVPNLYNLTSTSNVSITGASFLHAIHNSMTDNTKLCVYVNNGFLFHFGTHDYVAFDPPLPLTSARVSPGGATGLLIYS
jgi:hypothetical protein